MPDAQRPDPMSDEAAEAALLFLVEFAPRAGKAKANMIYMENYRKVLLARLKRAAPAECRSADAREDWARDHPDYKEHLQAQREAVAEHETLFWRRTAAEATIEAWRTRNANNRSADRMQ